jgi:hypothetical protein
MMALAGFATGVVSSVWESEEREIATTGRANKPAPSLQGAKYQVSPHRRKRGPFPLGLFP